MVRSCDRGLESCTSEAVVKPIEIDFIITYQARSSSKRSCIGGVSA